MGFSPVEMIIVYIYYRVVWTRHKASETGLWGAFLWLPQQWLVVCVVLPVYFTQPYLYSANIKLFLISTLKMKMLE